MFLARHTLSILSSPALKRWVFILPVRVSSILFMSSDPFKSLPALLWPVLSCRSRFILNCGRRRSVPRRVPRPARGEPLRSRGQRLGRRRGRACRPRRPRGRRGGHPSRRKCAGRHPEERGRQVRALLGVASSNFLLIHSSSKHCERVLWILFATKYLGFSVPPLPSPS